MAKIKYRAKVAGKVVRVNKKKLLKVLAQEKIQEAEFIKAVGEQHQAGKQEESGKECTYCEQTYVGKDYGMSNDCCSAACGKSLEEEDVEYQY